MVVELRYNLNHKNGDKPWKVFIDGQLLKVDSVQFNCPIFSSVGQNIDGKSTAHIKCDSEKIVLTNSMLVVE